MAPGHKWDDALMAKLHLAILAINHDSIKIDNGAVANLLGSGITAKAVSHKTSGLKSMLKGINDGSVNLMEDANEGNGTGETPATPKSKVRSNGASGGSSKTNPKSTGGGKKRKNGSHNNEDDEDVVDSKKKDESEDEKKTPVKKAKKAEKSEVKVEIKSGVEDA